MSLPARLLIADPARRLVNPGPALGAPLSEAVLAELGLLGRGSIHQWTTDGRRLRGLLPVLLRQPGWSSRVCIHDRAGLVVVVEPRGNGKTPSLEPCADVVAIVQAALARTAAAEPPSAQTRPRLAKPAGLMSVMVVEDDPMVRAVCRRMLQDRYFVLEAVAAAEALALADWLPWPADLLVSDVNLPAMDGVALDGVALAGQWRRHWPMCGILLLSGSFVPEAAGNAEALFLQKPFQADAFLRSTETLLGVRLAPKLPA